ncbi:MAG: dihydrodipicolinate synthase family protein [Chloroflexota bacterium]|nr:dihydrodipicolinate synthase family protein [Chloroflexota bacterium]
MNGAREYEAVKAQLRGPIAFPITPYAADGSVDLGSVARNAAWLPEHGICALVAPSGTGEIFALSPDECAAVTTATVQAVAGRVPVIASVGFNARIGADLAARAEATGADAVLVMPPYYAAPDPRGLLEYYRQIAAATSLGVLPYARDAAAFTPELVEELARLVPNLIAFKDGRGDVRLFQRLREHTVERMGADRLLWLAGVGDDLVAAYFAAGAEGFTSSLACFWPEASAELYRLVSSGDFAGVRHYHERVVRPFYELRQRGRGFEVSVMKAAMELLGHPAGPVRPPLGSVSARDRADLQSILQRLEVPTASERTREPVGAPRSQA